MKAILLKTETGLIGSTPKDHELWLRFKRRLETMKPGTWLRMEWAVPRNGKHHRKLYALLALITTNSETYDTIERALVAVKMAAGFYEPHVDPMTGEVQKVPHSIAYESMDQDAFDAFYAAAIHGVVSAILPQFDEATMYRLLDEIVNGWVAGPER